MGWIVEDTKDGQKIKARLKYKKNKLFIEINLIIFINCEALHK